MKEDIIRMAREAGFTIEGKHTQRIHGYDRDGDYTEEIECLVELVRADERNRTWTQKHWTEYERSIVEAEREALKRMVFDDAWALTFQTFGQYRTALAAAIRARGAGQVTVR